VLSFKSYLAEKKSKILINPKKDELKEVKKEHGEDCDCIKCEQKRRREDVNDGPDVQNEASYTGPDKKDRALIKKMDNPSYLKKFKDYEKNMDPKKRQALKDKATKGMKFTHEGKDLALDMIRKKYKDQIMKRGQPKKVKGAKSTAGTGKYKKMADEKKQTAADAKKRGFKDVQSYVNTMARYGGKDNYDKGKGLGT
jgi:hypothetical protein